MFLLSSGKTFAITNTEKNFGTTNMTVASNVVKFYLSTDAIITTADIAVGSRSVLRLLAGKINATPTTITVPGTVLPRVYYVGACADATLLQLEATLAGVSLETNNCKAALGTINVVRNVDLVVSSASTLNTTTVVGGNLTITSSVQNVGTAGMLVGATSTTRFYLSTDSTITSADILLSGTRVVGTLAAGGVGTITSTVVTLPASVVPGTYYIGVMADGLNQVLESVESNNSSSPSVITITVT